MKGVFCLGRHYYYVNLIGKLQQIRTDKNVTNISDKSEARAHVFVLVQNKKGYVVKAGKYCILY